MENNIILIMAGGLGKRMNSTLPKVLFDFNKKPLIIHIIENSLKLNPFSILLIVGKYKLLIQDTIEQFINKEYWDKINYIIQEEPKGTGHAIMCAKDYLSRHLNKNILILSGDTPLVDNILMEQMLNNLMYLKICITNLQNPYGYGRMVDYINHNNSKYTKIIEEKDCNEQEKSIQIVNCGVYAFNIKLLLKYLSLITNNNKQNEYYLTQLIEIITINENIKIELLEIDNRENYKVLGINTREQLLELENIIKNI